MATTRTLFGTRVLKATRRILNAKSATPNGYFQRLTVVSPNDEDLHKAARKQYWCL